MHKDPHLQWIAVKPGEIPALDHLARGGYIIYNDVMLMKASREMAKYKEEYKIIKAKRQISDLKQRTMDQLRDRSGKKLGMIQDTVTEEVDF
jgi:hypothetical protein